MSENDVYNRRWLILFIIVLMTFMCCIDSSIVNIALPQISMDLKTTMSVSQWAVTTYLLIISALILTFGRISDILGKARIYKAGVVIFTLGSLLAGLSRSIEFLLIARIVQALGATCAMSTNKGIITAVFSKSERGKALGISSLVVALGVMAGPALGGIICEYKWQYIFFINVPIGIIVMILAFKFIPTVKNEGTSEPIDFMGTSLLFVSITLLIIALTEGSIYGYLNTYVIIGYIIGIMTLIIFVFSQKKIKYPLIDLNIFKNHMFTKGVIASALMYVAITTYTILFPFYYEEVRGYSSGVSGLLMLAYPIAISIFAPISGHLSDKYRKDIFPLIGLSLCTIGFFLISTMSVRTNIILILFYLFIIGIGNGFFQSPMTSIVMSSVTKDKLGIAGSFNGFVRNIGMVCGITFGTSLLYDLMSWKLGYRVRGFVQGQKALFVNSMDIVYFISGVVCLIGVLILISITLRVNKEKKIRYEK